MEKYTLFIIWCILVGFLKASPLPINLTTLGANNKGSLEFTLLLPNNETLKIDLSFQLMKLSGSLNNPQGNTENRTTITTTSTERSTVQYFTVEEAIEAFRQDLIRKEREIAGIIESENKFYRHFRLEFNEKTQLTNRCTYDSSYKDHKLNISCYEYREYETERILSNGEIEVFTTQDTSFRSDVELININKYKQTYEMIIT